MTARKETIVVAIMTAVLVTAAIEVPEHWPVKVHAQEQAVRPQTTTLTDTSNPHCAISSGLEQRMSIDQGAVAYNAGTPGFVCVADLDGTGTKEVIVGNLVQVTIINNTGAIRKTVQLPQ